MGGVGQSATCAFNVQVARAIGDEVLQQTIRKRQDARRELQNRATAELPDWEAWKDAVQALRSHTVANLDYYLDQFADNVERHGGHIFFAANADEARDYVAQLSRAKKAQRIVKAKSMLTEEVGLNKALEATGAEVLETDLGEFIIQLAHETPFHILGPASHKTPEEIRELFRSLPGGEAVSSEPHELAAFARQYLRQKFLSADMGVSGCNFGVASEGSVVLVTNEGNGRLTTSLPRTHVVLMGMERLVPDLQSLEPMLTVLPRSANGVRSTAYVTIISGPRRPRDEDGPDDLHVVIVDNGRSRILGGGYREILNCIRCGACLDNCPVYRHIGGHAYGPVYSGPIGAVLTPLLWGLDTSPHLPFVCSLCHACNDVCSARIPLAQYLVDLRSDVVGARLDQPTWRAGFRAFSEVTKRPGLWELGVRLARVGLRPWKRDAAIRRGPKFLRVLRKWTDSRDFPSPASRSFREQWRKDLDFFAYRKD